MKVTLKMFKQAVKNGMKALHIDTETCLGTFCGFQIGSKVRISHEQILTSPQVMSVQYKWEGEKEAFYIEWDKVGEQTVYDSGFDNSSMLKETSRLIKESDIVIGQNINAFDMKMLQDGLVNNSLPYFDYDVTLDILTMSRKVFRPLSQKLDARATKYGMKGKIKMELQDWKDVTFNGKPISAKMGPYGVRDVNEAQKVFYREFNHYKLPKNVERLVLSFLTLDKKIYCKKCADSHQRRYDVKVKQRKDFKEVTCNRCGDKWELHGTRGKKK